MEEAEGLTLDPTMKTPERIGFEHWVLRTGDGSPSPWAAWEAACKWKDGKFQFAGWQKLARTYENGLQVWELCGPNEIPLGGIQTAHVRPIYTPVLQTTSTKKANLKLRDVPFEPSPRPALKSPIDHFRIAREDRTAMRMMKAACRLHTDELIHRYLMSCADGREDGFSKAVVHKELCEIYVAIYCGFPESRMSPLRNPLACKAVHSATQDGLTDRMDEVIGFPLKGRPDYELLAPLFFEKFHAIALATLKN